MNPQDESADLCAAFTPLCNDHRPNLVALLEKALPYVELYAQENPNAISAKETIKQISSAISGGRAP